MVTPLLTLPADWPGVPPRLGGRRDRQPPMAPIIMAASSRPAQKNLLRRVILSRGHRGGFRTENRELTTENCLMDTDSHRFTRISSGKCAGRAAAGTGCFFLRLCVRRVYNDAPVQVRTDPPLPGAGHGQDREFRWPAVVVAQTPPPRDRIRVEIRGDPGRGAALSQHLWHLRDRPKAPRAAGRSNASASGRRG